MLTEARLDYAADIILPVQLYGVMYPLKVRNFCAGTSNIECSRFAAVSRITYNILFQVSLLCNYFAFVFLIS